MQYFAGTNRSIGIHYDSTYWMISVNGPLANSQQIGEAAVVEITPNGVAIWRLHVNGAEVPGRWVVSDGRFISAEKVWR
jgi:hypothetical protein